MRSTLGALGLAIALAGTACVKRGSDSPEPTAAASFPSRANLDALANKPPPPLKVQDAVSVPKWMLSELLETKLGETTYVDDSPWGRMMSDAAKRTGGRVTLSKPLRCAAEQMGRFFAQHGALPEDRLQRFILGRCGAHTPARPYAFAVKATPDVTDAQIVAAESKGLSDALDKRFAQGRHLAAIWSTRLSNVAIVSIIAGRHLMDVSGPAQPNARGEVILHGNVHEPAEALSGFINAGNHGVKPCRPNPHLKLPRFQLTCPMAPGDATAWIDVVARRPGRLMSNTVGQILARRPDRPALEYAAGAASTPATSVPQFHAQVLQGVNQYRQSAGLGAVALAPAQTATNSKFAPYYFDPAAHLDGGGVAAADQIAMGLMAGWDVQGTIQAGSILSEAISGTSSGQAWVELVASSPLGRTVLLDPPVQQLGVGAVLAPQNKGAAALVTTYSFFDTRRHAADAQRFFDYVARVRGYYGLGPPVRYPSGDLEAQAALIHQGKATIVQALTAASQRISGAVRRAVLPFSSETNFLDRVQLPKELLGRTPPSLAVAVTHRKVPGAAWGQFVLLVIITNPPSGQAVASGPRVMRTL